MRKIISIITISIITVLVAILIFLTTTGIRTDNFNSLINEKVKEIDKNLHKIWPEGKDERKLIEIIWKLLLSSKDQEIKSTIINYLDSNSMTLSKAALNVFTRIECPEREKISNLFLAPLTKNHL